MLIRQVLTGGGDVQRNNIAIASLEFQNSTLIARRTELERSYESEENKIREKVLGEILKFESASRNIDLVTTQLNSYQQRREVIRIRYRFGNGSTNQIISLEEQGERLENRLIDFQIRQEEALRNILELTGYEMGE